MKLAILHGDRTTTVEILRRNSKEEIRINGEGVECDWARLADGRYSLVLEGRVYDLTATVSGDICTVEGSEGVLDFRVADPRGWIALRPVEDGRKGLQRIVAEMPGKVIRVLVQPGDEVSLEQGLLVVEAMKMQNEIRSPRRGVIREIGVVEGRAVNSGDFLLSLE